MANQQLSTNTFTTAKWIVSATASDGTHTTIASALTSASSGDTIFIRPGTYTENLTLKAGVNLTAFQTDSSSNGTGDVIISGKATFTAAGTVTIAGIQLQTNSDFFLAVTGSAASVVTLNNCYLNCSNNTGISYTSSSGSSSISILNCVGNIGTTGISLFSCSAGGTIYMQNSRINNTGTSSTASTMSGAGGLLQIRYCQLNILFSISSSATIDVQCSNINNSTTNSTCVTLAGTGLSISEYSLYYSGTASALSIGAGTTFITVGIEVNSSNANVVTGAGTWKYAFIAFSGSSSAHNVTTETALATLV